MTTEEGILLPDEKFSGGLRYPTSVHNLTQEEYILFIEEIENLKGRFFDMERTMLNYFEKNPTYSDQWVEARLRALESFVKILRNDVESLIEKTRNLK